MCVATASNPRRSQARFFVEFLRSGFDVSLFASEFVVAPVRADDAFVASRSRRSSLWCQILCSDLDVIWLGDPRPWLLGTAKYSGLLTFADVVVSTDVTSARHEADKHVRCTCIIPPRDARTFGTVH